MVRGFRIALALVVIGAAPLVRAQRKVVRIESGLISGVAEPGGVTAFKGIPYAAPPVGDLRWRPPQPAAKWSGVRKAAAFCSPCMQAITGDFGPYTREFLTAGPASEDCLFLNVWTAARSTKEKRPVMVWIYGGGFVSGGADVPIYDGAALARKGVVLVSINYRVGALGFLAHPELTKESEHHASGNYGLLDMVAALEWVHRNIKPFGGDPQSVTIFGQSAGAISVNLLMRSPLAKGLFARAIIESGPGLLPAAFVSGRTKLAAAEQAGVQFAESKGAHSLAELRAVPASALVARGGLLAFGPITDGWFLPEINSPASEVPVMVGMTADDISVGAGFGPPSSTTAGAYEREIRGTFGQNAEALLKLYPAVSASISGIRKSIGRDRGRVSISLWAANQDKLSGRVYTYFFSRPIPWPEHPEFGAFHTAEVPYVFDNLSLLNRPWEAADRRLAIQISSYWLNFARTGNPNGPGLPVWNPIETDSHTTMELGTTVGPMPLAEPAKLAFWEALLKQR